MIRTAALRLIRSVVLGLAFWPPLGLGVLAGERTSDPEATLLLEQGAGLLRSSGTIVEYRLEIVRPEWTRTLRFRSHQDYGNNRMRLEVLEPAKVRGTLFLKLENRLSMYLPKLRREIAVSPAMMHDPWMGSDFNNQDLVESGSLVEDYHHRILSRETQDGTDIFTIESVPRPDAPVAWGKLIQRVRAGGLPVSLEYFDAQGRSVRTLSVLENGNWGGRTIPSRLRMQPSDASAQSTEIVVESVLLDQSLPEELFGPAPRGET